MKSSRSITQAWVSIIQRVGYEGTVISMQEVPDYSQECLCMGLESPLDWIHCRLCGIVAEHPVTRQQQQQQVVKVIWRRPHWTPLTVGEAEPHLIQCFFGPRSLYPKQYLDPFSQSFLQCAGTRQADRYTTLRDHRSQQTASHAFDAAQQQMSLVVVVDISSSSTTLCVRDSFGFNVAECIVSRSVPSCRYLYPTTPANLPLRLQWRTGRISTVRHLHVVTYVMVRASSVIVHGLWSKVVTDSQRRQRKIQGTGGGDRGLDETEPPPLPHKTTF